MTQVFALHSSYGLMTAVAAIDEGLIPENGQRLLLSVNSARVPETAVGIDEAPRLRSLRDRFDRVVSLNALVAPMHPTAWQPLAQDLALLERLFTEAWSLDDDLELFVQSPQVAPARTLMSLFPNASIGVIGDGLMTYSPIRVRLPRTVVERVGRVIHTDVVPGVEPLVFGESGAQRIPVPPVRLRTIMNEVGDAAVDLELEELLVAGERPALILGQYLSALGLVTQAEEIALQQDMVDRAHAERVDRIVFKPHPAAPPVTTHAVRERARRHGVAFVEYRGELPAEFVAERLDAAIVIAGFSTALPTVRALYDRPVASVGAHTLLQRLTPYENSNRMPATIVDAMTRPGSPYRAPGRMQELVDAVGYCMQPKIMAHLRPGAEELLARLDAAESRRYFDPERLRALRLPGAPREGKLRSVLRSAGNVGRLEEVRLTISGARQRAARVWKVARGL